MTMPAGPRRALVAGGILGLCGVAAGAFGAHALRGAVSPRDLQIWETAARYQLVHAVVLVAVAGLARQWPARVWTVCVTLLTGGVVVFSGTLYAMVLGGPRILGAVTPVGGLCLMAGWATLVVAAVITGSGPRGDP